MRFHALWVEEEGGELLRKLPEVFMIVKLDVASNTVSRFEGGDPHESRILAG